MLDVKKCLEEAMFFEGGIEKQLTPSERYLGSDMYVRVYPSKAIIYYINSSDQIEIPGPYLNLFQILQVRDGDRLREEIFGDDLGVFVSLGIELPGILLYQTNPKGIRSIICRMVLSGTSKIREIIPSLQPWTLSNINNTIEI